MVLRSLALALVLGGCAPEPAATSREAQVSRRLARVGSIRAFLPDAWEDVSPAVIDRLRAAALRRDPEGSAAVVALRPADGRDVPGFSLTVVDQSVAYGEGVSVRESVEGLRQGLDEGARSRGLQVELDVSCGARHCDARWTLSGAGPRQQNIARFWRAGGRIRQRACSCLDASCAEIERCELPEPPPGALPVDAQVP